MTNPNTHHVLNEVLYERVRQDEKWGEQNYSFERHLAILAEEFGEASKAVVELGAVSDTHSRQTWRANLREELIQTAATAVSFIERMDRTAFLVPDGAL